MMEMLLSGKPVSCDTAMCLLDPKIQELVDLQRKDVSLRHCFEDATKEESCFIVDEKTQVLFRHWDRLKFKYRVTHKFADRFQNGLIKKLPYSY